MGAVKNAMQRDGLDTSIKYLDPERSVTSQLDRKEALVDNDHPLKLKEDEEYSKYFKMLRMVSKSE